MQVTIINEIGNEAPRVFEDDIVLMELQSVGELDGDDEASRHRNAMNAFIESRDAVHDHLQAERPKVRMERRPCRLL